MQVAFAADPVGLFLAQGIQQAYAGGIGFRKRIGGGGQDQCLGLQGAQFFQRDGIGKETDGGLFTFIATY